MQVPPMRVSNLRVGARPGRHASNDDAAARCLRVSPATHAL